MKGGVFESVCVVWGGSRGSELAMTNAKSDAAARSPTTLHPAPIDHHSTFKQTNQPTPKKCNHLSDDDLLSQHLTKRRHLPGGCDANLRLWVAQQAHKGGREVGSARLRGGYRMRGGRDERGVGARSSLATASLPPLRNCCEASPLPKSPYFHLNPILSHTSQTPFHNLQPPAPNPNPQPHLVVSAPSASHSATSCIATLYRTRHDLSPANFWITGRRLARQPSGPRASAKLLQLSTARRRTLSWSGGG